MFCPQQFNHVKEAAKLFIAVSHAVFPPAQRKNRACVFFWFLLFLKIFLHWKEFRKTSIPITLITLSLKNVIMLDMQIAIIISLGNPLTFRFYIFLYCLYMGEYIDTYSYKCIYTTAFIYIYVCVLRILQTFVYIYWCRQWNSFCYVFPFWFLCLIVNQHDELFNPKSINNSGTIYLITSRYNYITTNFKLKINECTLTAYTLIG